MPLAPPSKWTSHNGTRDGDGFTSNSTIEKATSSAQLAFQRRSTQSILATTAGPVAVLEPEQELVARAADHRTRRRRGSSARRALAEERVPRAHARHTTSQKGRARRRRVGAQAARENAPETLAANREMRDAFERKMAETWGGALDLFEMLVGICLELGDGEGVGSRSRPRVLLGGEVAEAGALARVSGPDRLLRRPEIDHAGSGRGSLVSGGERALIGAPSVCVREGVLHGIVECHRLPPSELGQRFRCLLERVEHPLVPGSLRLVQAYAGRFLEGPNRSP
jgi:hypothetical protein